MQCILNKKSAFINVDKIDPSQIITTTSKIFDVDINSCKVDDLQFSSEYTFQVLPRTNYPLVGRQDFNSLVMWFEVDFPLGEDKNEQERIILSTSPRSEFTHWKH